MGDVIFVGSRSKGIVSKGQSIVRKNADIYSHVALNFTGDVCIHSTPVDGVHLDAIESILVKKDKNLEFIAFRLKSFQENDIYNLYWKISTIISPYLNKPYNYIYFIKPKTRFRIRRKSTDNTFCSELVSNFYKSIGISTSSRPTSSTLPADILAYFRNHASIWEDVSNIYEKYLQDGLQDGELGLRQQIQRNQIKDLKFALKVSSERINSAISYNYETMEVNLRYGRRKKPQDVDKTQYKVARRNYIMYHKYAKYSMSNEISQLFLSRRVRLLKRFRKVRARFRPIV